MMTDEELYEKLKEAFEILRVSEDADESAIKKSYRMLLKKYHPDASEGDEEKSKKITVAYNLLKKERGRYKELKERFGNKERENDERNKYKSKEQSWRNQSSTKQSREKKEEKTNKYIFRRIDGSKIEIQPIEKHNINGEIVYEYKVIQYYNNVTFINTIFGRINLEELMRTPEYCYFCVNNFLSKKAIEDTVLHFNGYVGYIEMASKNGRRYYRSIDREEGNNFDTYIDIGDLTINNGINVEEDNYDLYIERTGTVLINGKQISQYIAFSECDNIYELVYVNDINFKKIEENHKYKNSLIKDLLSIERIRQKSDKEGGYLGGLTYNPLTDDYDLIVDSEIREFFKQKNRNKER